MSARRRDYWLAVLSGVLLSAVETGPAFGVNRCRMPSGNVQYTELDCQSIGGRHVREINEESISTVPLQPVRPEFRPQRPAVKPAAEPEAPPRRSFQRSIHAPTLTVCYDAQEARSDAPGVEEMGRLIVRATSLWAEGCNVNFRYLGGCTEANANADYRVWWGDSERQSVAYGGPRTGVSLNTRYRMNYPYVLVHEFGHVIGIGHSPNPGDVMHGNVGDSSSRLEQFDRSSMSARNTGAPSAADYDVCNRAASGRWPETAR